MPVGMPPRYEGRTARLSMPFVTFVALVLVAVGLLAGSFY